MARWNVEGADAKTGAEKVIQVEAGSQAEAEARAAQQGLLVSAAFPSTVQTRGEQLDAEVAAVSFRPPAAPAPPRHPPAPTLDYRGPAAPETPRLPPPAPAARIPEYGGLKIGAAALAVFAILYYIAAALSLVVSILAVTAGNPRGSDLGAGMLFLGALGFAMVGAVLHALSEACTALRDIARNSFR